MVFDFQTATSENCAAIFSLKETSHLPSRGDGITLNLSQPENQATIPAALGIPFLEVVVQTTTYIQFAFVVLHSRGGSWELVDAFSLCCLTWHFWKILGE